MRRSGTDPDVFFSQVFQLRDKLSDLGEAVSDKRLTTIILDALPEEIYFTLKMQLLRGPKLGFEEITSMMKKVLFNHSERSSVTNRSQKSYRKSRDNGGREAAMNGRESAITTVITCHDCKRPGHRLRTVDGKVG